MGTKERWTRIYLYNIQSIPYLLTVDIFTSLLFLTGKWLFQTGPTKGKKVEIIKKEKMCLFGNIFEINIKF